MKPRHPVVENTMSKYPHVTGTARKNETSSTYSNWEVTRPPYNGSLRGGLDWLEPFITLGCFQTLLYRTKA